jgi:hypothetical protein
MIGSDRGAFALDAAAAHIVGGVSPAAREES